jgi:hypothetical protein
MACSFEKKFNKHFLEHYKAAFYLVNPIKL